MQPSYHPAQSAQILKMVSGHFSAFTVGYEFIADLLAFAQIADTGAFDGADVNEGVSATSIRSDEAKALLSVEPLHGSRWHRCTF